MCASFKVLNYWEVCPSWTNQEKETWKSLNTIQDYNQLSMDAVQAYASYKVSISLEGIHCPDSHHIQNFQSDFLQVSSTSIFFLVVYTFIG